MLIRLYFIANIFENGSTTFCDGENVTLFSTQHGNPYVFQWLLNGNEITGEVNDSLIVSTPGDYSLIVDSLGCSDTSNIITVNVNPLPTVSINSIPGFINYYESPLSLTGNPTGGTFSGNGISGNSFNPNTAGLGSHTIFYEYTDSNNCSNSTNVSIIVYDTTGIVCTSYDTVITNVYDTSFVTITDTVITNVFDTTYVTINDTIITNVFDTTYVTIMDTITLYDTIYVSVTDTLIIDVALTGINPPNNINTLKIYPNPASTHIYINNGNYTLMGGYTIIIVNSLSQIVFNSPIDQAEFYIDLSTWTGYGLYIVKIIDNNNNIIETKKIILQ